jgi:hypothetical protein
MQNLDFKGKWRCREQMAEIEIYGSRIFGHSACVWVGVVNFCGLKIFSLWDDKGDHFSDPRLNLKDRIDPNPDPSVKTSQRSF